MKKVIINIKLINTLLYGDRSRKIAAAEEIEKYKLT